MNRPCLPLPRLALATATAAMLSGTLTGSAAAQSATSYEFSNGSVIAAYGQANFGYMYYDDGKNSRGYFPVDNDNSSSRFGVTYGTDLGGDWSLLGRAEAEYQPRASNEITQDDPDAWDWDFERQNVRKFEATFANSRFGAISVGQGSMASDGVSDRDLSGTSVIGYSAVADTAGGFFYRQSDGTLSDITVGSTFSNLNGSRRMRARYDTPTMSSLTFSTSYGTDVIKPGDDNEYADVAVRYDAELDNLEVVAGLGYNWILRKDDDDSEFYSGSVSILQPSTGLNLSISGGARQQDDGKYGYIKLGWQKDFWSIGTTALAVDYYKGDDFANSGSTSESYSVMAVQNVGDHNLEIYGIYRVYSYDDSTASYEDGSVFMTGMRWKF